MGNEYQTRAFTADHGHHVAWYVDDDGGTWGDPVAGWLVQDEYETSPYDHPGHATGYTRVVAAIIVEAEVEPVDELDVDAEFVGLYPTGATPPADAIERAAAIAAARAKRLRERRAAAREATP